MLLYNLDVHVKVRFTLEEAIRPRGGVEVEFYSFFNLGTRWDCGPGTSVGIVTSYSLDGLGIKSQ
jgi:hypothetical protein